MTRIVRTAAAVSLAAGTLLALVPSAAAQPGPRLTEVPGTPFPHRSFVLSLPPGTSIDASDVVMRENGRAVSRLSVVPTRDAGKRFGTVLVIDASNSMRGQAIGGAMEAARAFATRRNPDQRLATVVFNAEASVLLPFTTHAGTIEDALAETPPLARGTNIYDAVAVALAMLEEAKIVAGSVVVLSDGADTGSAVDPTTVVRDATDAGVRIFSVGLRSPSFTPSSLRRLAAATGGDYGEATSADGLAAIFDEIGARLANEYLLKYRSLAGPDVDVRVEVAIAGAAGTATSRYVTPELPPAGDPFHRPVAETFWRSPAAMVLVALATAGLLAAGALAIFLPRRRDLRKRMAEFVSLSTGADEARSNAVAAQGAPGSAQKPLARTRWWTRLQEQLELAEVRTPVMQLVAATALATIAAAFVLYLIAGSPLLAPAALAVPFVARALLMRKVQKRRQAFAEQLPDNLQVLASALRAGHSLVGALSVVVDDSPEPARSEFRRIIADEQLGVSLEDAFAVVVRRMDNRDLEQVALVAALQRETGGNTAEVLDRVTDTIRERFELRRLVKTLTAQGRMSRWVVSLLPVGLLALITMLNPAYMKPLFTHPMGRVMLVVAAVMVVAGSFVIKKIVNIKV